MLETKFDEVASRKHVKWRRLVQVCQRQRQERRERRMDL